MRRSSLVVDVHDIITSKNTINHSTSTPTPVSSVAVASTAPVVNLGNRNNNAATTQMRSSQSGSRWKDEFPSPPPPPPIPAQLQRYPSHHSEAGRRYSVMGAPPNLTAALAAQQQQQNHQQQATTERRHSSVVPPTITAFNSPGRNQRQQQSQSQVVAVVLLFFCKIAIHEAFMSSEPYQPHSFVSLEKRSRRSLASRCLVCTAKYDPISKPFYKILLNQSNFFCRLGWLLSLYGSSLSLSIILFTLNIS